jgi:hypothetical protein
VKFKKGDIVKVTNVETHHFFVVNGQTFLPLRNAEGDILVFKNRGFAADYAEKVWDNFVVVGMGDEKWALFQKEQDYYEI